MFAKIFDRAINSRGLERRDIEYIIRSTDILTDEQIFVFSHFINRYRASNVFFTKYIGDLIISLRMFDIAICYEIKNKKGTLLCSMEIDFQSETLFVKYQNCNCEIGRDLMEYRGKNEANDIRMKVLNEVLVRYYTHILYAIYTDIHRKYKIQ